MMEKEELIKEFLKFKGKSKTRTTREENLKIKKQVSKEMIKELEKRFRQFS